MLPPSSATTENTVGARVWRVGFIALTDAAPIIAAEALGIFRQRGLNVELKREIGWATIREKIIYGELDATHAPAPMLWSTQLGLGCPACEVFSPLVLNRQGNALTLSQALWDAGVRDATTMRDHLRNHGRRDRLTLGVVFQYSFHHLMVRDWLRAAGIEPDRDVRIVVVPPAQMFRNLLAGTIDGFCVGEPWNSLAVHQGIGWCPTWSAVHQTGHIEKVLMVAQRTGDARAAELATLVAALVEAAAWCDEDQNRDQLAEILSEPRYLNVPAPVIATTLRGRFNCGNGRAVSVPDFITFHRDSASVPLVSAAIDLQRALGQAGLLTSAAASDTTLPRRLFREDLHREIAQHHLLHENVPSLQTPGLTRSSA